MAIRNGILNNHRKKVIWSLVLLLAAAAGIFAYVKYRENYITTDDAFVTGNIHVVASKVPGTILTIHVQDNQFVKKDTLLIEIDIRDQDTKVREADSALGAERAKLVELSNRVDVARKQLSELEYKIETLKANLKLQEANLKQAELDVKRAENLIKTDAISRDRYDRTKTGHEIALAQVDAARDQLRQAVASVDTQKAIIRQAEAAYLSQNSVIRQKEAVLTAEELKKGYTKLYAPCDGYVTKKAVEIGNQIQPGQPLMAVVPLDSVWVTANYKETQLARIRKGQKVKIKVDTYPGKTFYGKVDSIMAGTGSVFSLFPPENATGNFVKVVQRIPVKIVLDQGTDPDHVLRVGMSVIPTIMVR
ncbi:MAG: HlyD family secretion protein [Syntrophales bacterium]